MKVIEKIKSIDKGTIIRTIMLVLTTINQVIAFIGSSSFATAIWYQWVSLIAFALTAFITAWENNDFTYYAKLGTSVLNALADGKITVDEVKNLLEKAKNNESEEK